MGSSFPTLSVEPGVRTGCRRTSSCLVLIPIPFYTSILYRGNTRYVHGYPLSTARVILLVQLIIYQLAHQLDLLHHPLSSILQSPPRRPLLSPRATRILAICQHINSDSDRETFVLRNQSTLSTQPWLGLCSSACAPRMLAGEPCTSQGPSTRSLATPMVHSWSRLGSQANRTPTRQAWPRGDLGRYTGRACRRRWDRRSRGRCPNSLLETSLPRLS